MIAEVFKDEPIPDEEYAIYSAVLETRFLGPHIRRVVLRSPTCCLSVHESLPQEQGIPAQLLLSHAARNLDLGKHAFLAFRLENRFRLPVPVSLVSDDELRPLCGESLVPGDAFYERFPGAQGLARVTRISIDRSLDQAVFYLLNVRLGLCASGSYYVLSRTTGSWQILREAQIHVA